MAAELKFIYQAPTAQAARAALDAFAAKYDDRFPAISRSWYNHWDTISSFFDYPEEIRKVIYTTNAIESLNSSLRKISRHRNLFPSEDALYKLFYLSLRNIAKKWTAPIRHWQSALNRFIIEFDDRITNK